VVELELEEIQEPGSSGSVDLDEHGLGLPRRFLSPALQMRRGGVHHRVQDRELGGFLLGISRASVQHGEIVAMLTYSARPVV